MNAVRTNKSMGDAAVDGLLAGLLAGIAMAVFLIIGGLIAGDSPAVVMGLFSPTGDGSAFIGGIAHLSVSAIYGMAFGTVLHLLRGRLPGWAAGLAFGFFLFVVAQYVIVPTTDSALRAFSSGNFFVAHLVYGFVVGWSIGRRRVDNPA